MIIKTIVTSCITTIATMSIKNYVKQPFMHLVMCNKKREPVQVEQIQGENRILQISNDSKDILALDVAAIFIIKEQKGPEWIVSKVLSNRIDDEHPIYIEPFKDLPSQKKNSMPIHYQIEEAQLFYTTCLGQKRRIVFKRDSKMIVQKGKPHFVRYSLTEECFNKEPYTIKNRS